MGPAELLLRHHQLEDKASSLRTDVERLEGRIETDPEVERLTRQLETARSAQEAAALRLRQMEREVEGHRAKVKSRNSELMSGRIRNPTELMQMSQEVDHMRARLAAEEDAELEVMAAVEAADAEVTRMEQELAAAGSRAESELPSLRRDLEAARRDLSQVELELEQLWAQVPPQYQSVYRRQRARPPVAPVTAGQCSACHVAITSSQLQHLRRGELIQCDNCSRILVAA